MLNEMRLYLLKEKVEQDLDHCHPHGPLDRVHG